MQLKASGLSLATHARNYWFVEVDSGTTLDQMTDPDYWVNVKSKFNSGAAPDRIEVISKCRSLYAEILVIGKASLGEFSYRVINSHEAQTVENGVDIDSGKYRVEFAGASGWRVLKRQGRGFTEMASNLADQAAGVRWIDDYKKVIAA